MKITDTHLAGLKLIRPEIYTDKRGFFAEVFQQEHYAKHAIPAFVQDNISRSKKHTLRGLHYQLPPHDQGKLVWVVRGKVWDVAVDIRVKSTTFSQWFATILSDEDHLQMYIPPGFAHGFCVLSDEADFYYKCTKFYEPRSERGIIWNDPQLEIPWPINDPILSTKDKLYSSLLEIAHDDLFA